MKKFAILAVVFAFAGVMLAGCPTANNTKAPSNTGGNTAAPANNG